MSVTRFRHHFRREKLLKMSGRAKKRRPDDARTLRETRDSFTNQTLTNNGFEMRAITRHGATTC